MLHHRSPEFSLQCLGTAVDDKSTPLLVVSLTCHHCIDTLIASLRHPQLGIAHGPKILLSVAPQNFELHQYILAATLLYPNPTDGFTAVFSQLTPMRDTIISNNMGTLKPYLLTRFPRLTETLSAAKSMLVEQEKLLLPLNVVATPTLIQPNGIMQYHAEPRDILFLSDVQPSASPRVARTDPSPSLAPRHEHLD